jgi:hypothetical protein
MKWRKITMSSRLALREIEKRAWLRTFEHGMWDIGIGSLFLMFGVSILTAFPALSAIWVAALFPALRELGRKVVVPRVGKAQFRGRRRRANANTTWILAAVAALGLGALLMMLWRTSSGSAPAWIEWATEHFVVLIGLIWGGALVVTAWIVDFPRLYVYGALLFASLLVTDLVRGYHLGTSLSVVGGLILFTGIVLLIRFLRRYPRQDAPGMEPHE